MTKAISIARIRLKSIIEDLCEQAGCSKEEQKIHVRQFLHGWQPHPPQQFLSWWQPEGRDKDSGADTGGHPEARRQWARKDADGYAHHWYGITAESAYNCATYKDEYEAWVLAGCPEKPAPFMSMAAPRSEQKKFWQELKPVIAQIGKPMPKITPGDVSLESTGEEEIPFDETT